MPTCDRLPALVDYEAALRALYRTTRGGDRSGAALAGGPDLEQRAREYEDRSAELGEQIATARKSTDSEQRELAAVQLLAAAAADLHVAGDLVAAEPRTAGQPAERGGGGGVPKEVL